MNGRNRRFVAILGMIALLALATTAPATAATIEEVDIFNTLYGTSESTATLLLLLLPDAFWNLGGGATVTAEYKDADLVQNFGFYTDSGIGAEQTPLLELISANGYLSGSPVFFDPGVPFGFYTDPSIGGPYYTENFTDGSFPHFRTYQTPVPGKFVIFTEDLPGGGDRDYNDFVVSVQAVPEPATLLLLGTGLVMVGVRYRRRNGTPS